MAGFFSFPQYLNQLISTKGSTPKEQTTKEVKWTLQDIKQETRSQDRNIKWSSEVISAPEYENSEQIMKKAKDFCIALEIWASELEVQGGTRPILVKQGKCSPNATNRGYGNPKPGARCSTDRSNLRWIVWGDNQENSWAQADAKSLRACVDIVQIIISSFGVSQGLKGSPILKNQQGACGRVSSRLEDWGGPSLRDKIMSDWFTSGSQGAWSSQGYTMSGTDFFDVLQQLVVGDDKAEKNVGCRKIPQESVTTGHCHAGWCDEELNSGVLISTGGMQSRPSPEPEGTTLDSGVGGVPEAQGGSSSGIVSGLDPLHTGSSGSLGPVDGEQVNEQSINSSQDQEGKVSFGGNVGDFGGFIGGGIAAVLLAAMAAYGLHRISGKRRGLRRRNLRGGTISSADLGSWDGYSFRRAKWRIGSGSREV
ncbi:hypothetical protein C922_05387 [Plasmodium inui San Antonio 1]|uniref:Uncharacterized protein n=1 Tax=Plasmodium inui San Antonio 1 TaxID=1237626 RepID=W6ZTJ6_9APIC|nr:hypothetical protein C922_05387 [Plasmodium inui San Antonio 1]EUD64232.1 hypothetical protein C922_05387 [Plasmodium inui San Antonio 1]